MRQSATESTDGFAAVGVMATLFYLAWQVSESVGLARVTQNKGLMDSWEAYNNAISTSPDVAQVLATLANQNAELSPSESVQARHLNYGMMNICPAAEHSYEHNQIGAREVENHRMSFANVLKTYPGLARYAIEILELYPGLRRLDAFKSISGLVSQT